MRNKSAEATGRRAHGKDWTFWELKRKKGKSRNDECQLQLVLTCL